jgi:hypothetical protein
MARAARLAPESVRNALSAATNKKSKGDKAIEK